MMWRCFVFPFLLLLDQGFKIAAVEWIPRLCWGEFPFGGIPIFSDIFGISFSLNTIFNTGAAWGLFAGNPGLLFVLRVFIIFVLSTYLFYYHRPLAKMASTWLIATGAIGNAVDYLLYGHVVDFFHFVFWGYSFPIFNLADSYITIGVVIFFFKIRQPRVLPVL